MSIILILLIAALYLVLVVAPLVTAFGWNRPFREVVAWRSKASCINLMNPLLWLLVAGVLGILAIAVAVPLSFDAYCAIVAGGIVYGVVLSWLSPEGRQRMVMGTLSVLPALLFIGSFATYGFNWADAFIILMIFAPAGCVRIGKALRNAIFRKKAEQENERIERPPFQLSLARFLFLIIGLGIFFGLTGRVWMKYQRDARVEAAIHMEQFLPGTICRRHIEANEIEVSGGIMSAEQFRVICEGKKAEIAHCQGSTFDDEDAKILSQRERLRELDLSQTQITDKALASIGAMDSLESLDLSNNPRLGAGVQNLAALQNLKTLNLSNTGIGDSELLAIGGLHGLAHLNLSGTAITDAGLKHLQGLKNLEDLDLTKTGVTGPGLSYLKGLPRLHAAAW